VGASKKERVKRKREKKKKVKRKVNTKGSYFASFARNC